MRAFPTEGSKASWSGEWTGMPDESLSDANAGASREGDASPGYTKSLGLLSCQIVTVLKLFKENLKRNGRIKKEEEEQRYIQWNWQFEEPRNLQIQSFCKQTECLELSLHFLFNSFPKLPPTR